MKCVGKSFNLLQWLQVGDESCVELESLEGVDLKNYGYQITVMTQKYLVYAKPRFFTHYVREQTENAIKKNSKEFEVLSFAGTMDLVRDSERTCIYHECQNSGFRPSILYIDQDGDKQGRFVVTKSTASNKPPRLNPNWLVNMKEGETREFELKNMKFSEFRSRVYSTAKRKGIKLSVSWLEANKVSVTHKGKRSDAPESFHAKFNAFLDTIKPGDEVAPPEEFLRGPGKDAYIRVLVTKHRNPLKYRGGKVVYPTAPTTPRATIDSHGNFILDGKNLGPRDQRYIDLKLRPLGIKLGE